MSTSDRQEQGPLTRKQLREIRLTGSTPVISAEEAAAAAATRPAPSRPEKDESVEAAPAPQTAPRPGAETESGATPLTRRQVRERERSMTGSVPIGDLDDAEAPGGADERPVEEASHADETPADSQPDAEPVASAEPAASDEPVASDGDDDDDDDATDESLPEPVSASTNFDARDDHEEAAPEADDAAASAAELGIDAGSTDTHDEPAAEDVLAGVEDADDEDIAAGERPTVNSAFGQDLLSETAESRKPFAPSFDELLSVGDSTGSQHLAPNTLIFNPSPGDGSLSGPVASTGEILVTGSYELPKGLGSQGHAHGTTDGKDVDAVLIDGELPPASSPTPIAASAAVSTIKPAGEVIRPPAPEKGNKLMLILAIVAGGLALALGVSLIVAFTTNVF